MSKVADLCFRYDKISVIHIENLINSANDKKLDHGLTRSNINPKDRQKYHSCIKLISNDVLNRLNDDANTKGIAVYLTLLKMIVMALY